MNPNRLIALYIPLVALTVIFTLAGCNDDQVDSTLISAILQSEALPAGEATVSYRPFPSFMLPVANLPEHSKPEFYAGRALAQQPWIKAPATTTARDGLGPLYNARTCLGCHVNGGRGTMPVDGQTPLFAAFVRISVPGNDGVNGAVPEPVYGSQIQGQSVALSHQLRQRATLYDQKNDSETQPEAYVYLDWQTVHFEYPDGEQRKLRYPKLRFERMAYGPFQPDTMTSLRMAPGIMGVGLLDQISQRDIDRGADPFDTNADGISGRVNQVWDFQQERTVAGRFGWKANRANLRITTAAAFNGDVGISNSLFPQQPCSEAQKECNAAASGNGPEGLELPDHLLRLVVNFTANLGVPVRRGSLAGTEKGRELFHRARCSACHKPSYITIKKSEHREHLAGLTIWPYTDLLLHDMGAGLSDGRPDYDAAAAEWRTPPLWGLGLNKRVNGNEFLLHDGRANNIEEAILWHGGEAMQAMQYFIQLEQLDRHALIQFVESL